jgi:hypothetical protein
MGESFSGSPTHKVSNAWLLTKRSGVRIPSGEPHIFHFEILSVLLVNKAAAFTGGNGPYGRKPPLSVIRDIAR